MAAHLKSVYSPVVADALRSSIAVPHAECIAVNVTDVEDAKRRLTGAAAAGARTSFLVDLLAPASLGPNALLAELEATLATVLRDGTLTAALREATAGWGGAAPIASAEFAVGQSISVVESDTSFVAGAPFEPSVPPTNAPTTSLAPSPLPTTPAPVFMPTSAPTPSPSVTHSPSQLPSPAPTPTPTYSLAPTFARVTKGELCEAYNVTVRRGALGTEVKQLEPSCEEGLTCVHYALEEDGRPYSACVVSALDHQCFVSFKPQRDTLSSQFSCLC